MPEIEYKVVSVDLLRKNTFNSNKVSPLNEEKIRESIRRNGMFKPIIVREVAGVPGYEIIGGEHRWEQAIELGMTTVPIANLGPIDEVRAKEISVIDNARYGVDDTILLSEILKDIGDMNEIEHFLPFGTDDLSAIFSASDITLDSLELEDPDEEDAGEALTPAPKAPKTHTIMRFRLSLADSERMTALIAKTQKDHGFTAEDDLTNAGDALVYLLRSEIAPGTASFTLDDCENLLNEIEAERDAEE